MPKNLCRTLIKRLPWQFYYWSGVTILFACAAWQRFAVPLDPIADPDTWGYLSPALRELTASAFGHTSGRNFIYPGFLYLLLRTFGDFRAITVTQHFLGLLAGGVLLLTWRRTRCFVANPRVSLGSYHMLGLLAAAIFLLASEPIRLETQLRPEGVCAFLLSINLYVVIQFAACCFIEDQRLSAAVYGVAAVFTSILLASVKPSFVLVAIVALLPIGTLFFRRRWGWQKIVLAGGAAVSAVVLLLPEHFLSRNDKISQTFLPTTLFVVHANLICDQMADDIQRNAKVPHSPEWLERVHTTLSAEITKSIVAGPLRYSTLGFDPDYLMYDRSSIAAQLRNEFGSNVSALCAFYWFYYWRIWQQRPLAVVKKIGRQMAVFYKAQCPAYSQRKRWMPTYEYSRGVTSLDQEPYRKTWTAYPPAVEFMHRTEMLARSAPIVQQHGYIRKPLAVLAATYLPLLLIALALSALVFMRQDRRRHLAWLAALVLFVYSYNLASCLEVAVIHSLQNPRYLAVQVFFTILAQFLALWFILEFALGLRPRENESLANTDST
ncbi:MAG TPA: hypothetical protein VNE84_06715 [Candidatus Limnocylindria bacterium]|nr:hypothetical protein [Candidatus Limnocylindria bacterium]